MARSEEVYWEQFFYPSKGKPDGDIVGPVVDQYLDLHGGVRQRGRFIPEPGHQELLEAADLPRDLTERAVGAESIGGGVDLRRAAPDEPDQFPQLPGERVVQSLPEGKEHIPGVGGLGTYRMRPEDESIYQRFADEMAARLSGEPQILPINTTERGTAFRPRLGRVLFSSATFDLADGGPMEYRVSEHIMQSKPAIVTDEGGTPAQILDAIRGVVLNGPQHVNFTPRPGEGESAMGPGKPGTGRTESFNRPDPGRRQPKRPSQG